jgi:orotate phosphoribosyltransferase
VDVRRLLGEPSLRNGVSAVAVQYAGSNFSPGICAVTDAETGSVEGLRSLLMDDLTTDGGSKLAFASGRPP